MPIKRSNLVATLLTILMLLLVLISAIVFLVARNNELEELAEVFSGQSEEIETTRSHLESNIAVLESAYDAAVATRNALAGQNLIYQAEKESLMANSLEEESDQIAIDEPSDDLNPQLLIFAPAEGDEVRPLETITIVLAAWASAGIERVDLSFDNGEVVSYPASGLLTFTLPVQWQVPSEGNYTITAVAYSLEEKTSQTATVNISADYLNEEDRENARNDALMADLRLIRFPASAIESIALPDQASSRGLHLQLLTGWDALDSQAVYSATSVLQVFDFLPPGYDLEDYIQAVDGDLVAYSAPGMNDLVTVDSTGGDDSLGQWLQLHNLAHQMQNETFQLGALELETLDLDARTAIRALIEGEAVLIQYLYLQSESLDSSGLEEIVQGLVEMDSAILEVIPLYLRNEFEFAYSSGLDFVQYLYDQGGFEALDAAWRNPPSSTEQILHPEKYLLKEAPELVYLPSLGSNLDNGWQLINQDTFGEFMLREYLAQTLDSEQIDLAASGWAGGRYALYIDQDSDSRILTLRLAWDSQADQDEFDAAYRYFVDRRSGVDGSEQVDGGFCWEQAGVTCLYQVAGDTLVIRAPDLTIAQTVRQLIITS
jgi:hypothetical protein